MNVVDAQTTRETYVGKDPEGNPITRADIVYDFGSDGESSVFAVADVACAAHQTGYQSDCSDCRAMMSLTAEHLLASRGIEVTL